jgi:hypothetical protein
MGYSITAKDKSGTMQIAYYHYPESALDKPLIKALGVTVKNNDNITRTFSRGQLLDAKSKLVKMTGVFEELDFLDNCITETKITHNNIIITFN